MSHAELPGFVLVTPARNEAAHIGQTIDSVVAQTVRPLRWVIVSDGSTDGTDDIVARQALRHDWIELLRLPERRDRQFAAKVQAFGAGLQRLAGLPYEVLGNLDADITFGPRYFECLLRHFADEPRLGVAGTPYVEDFARPERHAYAHRGANLEHVSGACQLFRRACFEQIGGYRAVPGGGIDTIAGLAARMHGWQTRTFTDQVCFHHRPVGTAERGRLAARFQRGLRAWTVGGHPLWEMLRGLADMRRPPFVLVGASHLAGFGWGWLHDVPRVLPPALVAFHRREQLGRLAAVTGMRPSTGATAHVEVSRRGKVAQRPAASVNGVTVVAEDGWLRRSVVLDEDWLAAPPVSDPAAFVKALRASGLAADLFSFRTQGPAAPLRLADHPWRIDPDNLACIDVRDVPAWWEGLPQQTRKNVRRAAKKDLVVRVAPFDEAFARGIQRVYDETPIRQGRPFWHHGKSLEAVQRENATFLDRAVFIGAWVGEEFVGFIKAVRVGRTLRIMQILALVSEQDRRPTMALIAHAVELAHRSGLDTLVYDKMVYGNKFDSPMTEFKRRMGFRAVPDPRCTVALTWRGRVALALGLHRRWQDRLPGPIVDRVLRLRRWALAQAAQVRLPFSKAGVAQR
ncbi:MAG: glycosyltransferase [Rubrivivax sp.]